LKGNVIITGASSGIGKSLAFEFAKRGYGVGLLARRTALLEEMRKELNNQYGSSLPVEIAALDIAKDDNVYPAISAMSKKLGDLIIVVANAGITTINRTGAGDFEMDKRVIQVNLIGNMATVDAAAKIFRESGGGHIVGVSSVTAFMSIPGSGAYSASKAGFSSYLKAARAELAKRKILVSTIHPGFIDTDISKGMGKKPFVISSDKAAKLMVDAIEEKKPSVMIPAMPWSFVAKASNFVPEKLMAKMM